MSPAYPAGAKTYKSSFLLLESEVETAGSAIPQKRARPVRQERAAHVSEKENSPFFPFLNRTLISLFPEQIYKIVFCRLSCFWALESLARNRTGIE